jgi:hypothetical protein
MRQIAFVLIAVATVAGVGAYRAPAFEDAAAPIFVDKIPPGYRDWRLVSVGREEGELNDIRAVLGNDMAIKAYREGKPFPEGSIIARRKLRILEAQEMPRAGEQGGRRPAARRVAPLAPPLAPVPPVFVNGRREPSRPGLAVRLG